MDKIIITSSEELKALLDASFGAYMEKIENAINKNANPPKSKLTVKEVAIKLNVAELTIRNYINKGFIKAEKIGRRILIDSNDLEKSLSEVKSLKYRRSC